MARCESMGRAGDGARRSANWAGVAAIALLAGGVTTGGCTKELTHSELRAAPLSKEVVVTTIDERSIRFLRPFEHEDVLYGRVADCDGALLPPVRAPLAGPASRYRPLDHGCVRRGELGSIRLELVVDAQRPSELGAGPKAGIAAGALSAVVVTGTIIVGAALLGSGGGRGGGGTSCPRVYSFDGSDWRLDSGTYGAAFFEADQRTDHDLLEKLVEVDGAYRLRLMNELDETEHVDALRLVVVDHPKGSRVVPTPDGELLTFASPRAALRATDLRGDDVLAHVARRDGKLWASNLEGRDATRQEDTRDGLDLVFAKPSDAREMKLALTGMNTPEASQIVVHLLALQGDELPQVYERLNHSALARKLLRRLYVGVGLLTVSVRTPNGWSQRGVFEAAGNEIAKVQALRIDVSDLPGERVELRLESAVGMWHVDEVAVDYGADLQIEAHRLAPGRAFADDGRDVSATLSEIDARRLSSEPGQWAELTFVAPTPPTAGMHRSVVLETTGYDTLHVEPSPEANPAEANALMLSPGATSRRVLELLLADGGHVSEP